MRQWLLRLLLAVLFVSSLGADEGREALKNCINQHQPRVHSTSWGSTLSDVSSKFKVQGIWWSKSSTANSSASGSSALTLLTHLTLDQKWQLKALCKSWPGPLSAVVHVATIKERTIKPSSHASSLSMEEADSAGTAAGPAGAMLESTSMPRPPPTPTLHGAADTTAAVAAGKGSSPAIEGGGRRRLFSSRLLLQEDRQAAASGRGLAAGEQQQQQAGEAAELPADQQQQPGSEQATQRAAGESGQSEHVGDDDGGAAVSAEALAQETGEGVGEAADDEDKASVAAKRAGEVTGQLGAGQGTAKQQLKEAQARTQEMHASLERMHACQADVMLVHEVYLHEPEVADRSIAMYPDRCCKSNYARLQARTPLVAYVEVDMVVGSSLWKEMRDLHDGFHASATVANKTAWVLPTFLVSGSSRKAEAKEADRLAASGTKEDLARALSEDERGASSKKKLLLTRMDQLLASHLPTNYDRWLEQNVPYRIMYDEWYEPYVVVDRLGSAWGDIRMRGYQRGRPAQALALHQQGYHFMAHPRAFLMHRPHPTSVARQRYTHEVTFEAIRAEAAAWRRAKWERAEATVNMKHAWVHTQSLISHDHYLLNLISGAADQGVYRPVVDVALLSCMEELPWWGLQAARVTRANVFLAGRSFVATDWDREEVGPVDWRVQGQEGGGGEGPAGDARGGGGGGWRWRRAGRRRRAGGRGGGGKQH